MESVLLERIRARSFWSTGNGELIQFVSAEFPDELEELTQTPAAVEQSARTDSDEDTKSKKSPSRLLFGRDVDEVDRTMVSILCLKWILTGDYESFTLNQKGPARLTRASFEKLHIFFQDRLESAEDQYLVIVATIVNDLGKDTSLAAKVEKATGKSIEGKNHDVVLYEAVEAGLVPCMQRLEAKQRGDLVVGMKMGSRLNLGQLGQAENVPGSLDVMLEMKDYEHAFELKYLEQFLDVSGAAGHANPNGSLSMSQPVFETFMTVYKVLSDILNKRSTLREGYDEVLTQRAETVAKTGFRKLTVRDEQDRALLRLMAMSRTATKDQAEWIDGALNALEPSTKDNLINGLNVDGWEDGKAILPYYMPAALLAGIKNTTDDSAEAKINAIQSLLRFLTRILDGTHSEKGGLGEIVEHDVVYAKDLISGPEFKADPRVLDSLAITEASPSGPSLHI